MQATQPELDHTFTTRAEGEGEATQQTDVSRGDVDSKIPTLILHWKDKLVTLTTTTLPLSCLKTISQVYLFSPDQQSYQSLCWQGQEICTITRDTMEGIGSYPLSLFS